MFANNRILKRSKVRMFAKIQKLICSEVRMFVCSNVQVFHVRVFRIWKIVFYDWCAIEIMNLISIAQIKLTDIFWTPFYRIIEMKQGSCLYSLKANGLEPNWMVIWAKVDGPRRYWTVFSARVYGPDELKDRSERSQTVKVDGLKILYSESWRYYNLK